MASTTLTKITNRAKQIRRAHGGSWKTAVKKAGAEYRAGKIGRMKKSATKKKSRRKAVRRVKMLHRAEGRAIKKLSGVTSTFQAAAIGGLSTSQHIAHAKKKIEHEIAAAEGRKFVAKKKTTKRKIAKRITALKSKYRKLC